MARLRSLQLLIPPPAAAQGGGAFTLVELLVGVVLGSIVLGALGGALLVSEVKVSRKISTDINRRDSLNRAIALMRSEISSAGKVSLTTTSSALNPSDPCNPPNLYLWRAPSTIICYKPVTLGSGAVTSSYPMDRPWNLEPPDPTKSVDSRCVLLRKGPPYNQNGDLDTASPPIIQVLVDELVGCAPVQNAFFRNVGSASTASTSRDVDITINQQQWMGDGNPVDTISTSFSARIASNPAYAGMDIYGNTGACTSKCYTGSNTVHWMPIGSPATPVEGKPEVENIAYFQYLRSAYTLSGDSGSDCTYKNCNVTGPGVTVNLTNIDVLVFADQELRP